MTSKPKFKIKRQGYDRLTVDSYIDTLSQELEFANAKLNVYRKQLDFLSEQLEVKQDQNIQLLNDIRLINDNVDQLKVHSIEDNKIIKCAQESADEIILEALLIAKDILDTLALTSSNTKEYKDDLLVLLDSITKSIKDINIIEPLNIDLDI